MTDPNTQRKYRTELSLVITVVGGALLRASDLKKVEPPAEKCHLYLVSTTPFISVDPASVVVGKNALVGKVSVHESGEVVEHEFALRYAGDVAEWRSRWPHDEFELYSTSGERVTGGRVGLLGHLGALGWPKEASTHDVLYVGQAYGDEGARTAWDRLKGHETLQDILAARRPDREVWLTMARIGNLQIAGMISPESVTAMGDAADEEHYAEALKLLHEDGIDDAEVISMAEAGLIRGFRPPHNNQFKNTFPSPTHKTLETIRSHDFHSLIVEWQATRLDVETASAVDQYRSAEVPASSLAFFDFTIHTEPGRAPALQLADRRPVSATAQSELESH